MNNSKSGVPLGRFFFWFIYLACKPQMYAKDVIIFYKRNSHNDCLVLQQNLLNT